MVYKEKRRNPIPFLAPTPNSVQYHSQDLRYQTPTSKHPQQSKMAIITPDDSEQQSSTSIYGSTEHQLRLTSNRVNPKILEEKSVQKELQVGENLYMLSTTGC